MFEMYIQIILSAVMIVYVIGIVFITKSTYGIMKKHGLEEMVAVY